MRCERIALLILCGCQSPVRVTVLDDVARAPVPEVRVVFHRSSSVLADVQTDSFGVAELDADDPLEVSVRSIDHAETISALSPGAQIEVLIHFPEEERMLEIVPPAFLAMQADLEYSTSCGVRGLRLFSTPFMITTPCARETVSMIARDATGTTIAWSALATDGPRAEMPPWSEAFRSLEVRLSNLPDGGRAELEVVPLIGRRRGAALGAKVTTTSELTLPDPGEGWLHVARVWYEQDVTTRIWSSPEPMPVVDFASLLPRISNAIAAGDGVEWSLESDRVDGVVVTAVYPDESLLFWNVVLPPGSTRADFPPLPWTSANASEIDVELLDADFVADYAQRTRELGPGFYPRDGRASWSVDITTARRPVR